MRFAWSAATPLIPFGPEAPAFFISALAEPMTR